ncbi:MAG: DUF4097 family beta strand repeat protein [Saprospiraceae bacterium]|nr:DUF4097 family beta strand repeat protein [Saprospiraceae bacterium]
MKSFLIFFLAFGSLQVHAQKDYTVNMTSGTLKISEVNKVTIEGHSGPNVSIEIEDYDEEDNERAAGLKLISPSGLTDNTGIGLYVGKDDDNNTVIKAVSLRSDNRYVIKVPKAVHVYYEHSTHEGDELEIRNVASEVEVSARFNSVILKNASGPLAISTVHGDIDADFDAIDQSNSISLTSMHGHVDVTIPAQAKANFHLSSDWGEMYTDLDLTFETEEGMKTLSTKKIDAKYNGGGVDFTIKSNHSDIYLRKK